MDHSTIRQRINEFLLAPFPNLALLNGRENKMIDVETKNELLREIDTAEREVKAHVLQHREVIPQMLPYMESCLNGSTTLFSNAEFMSDALKNLGSNLIKQTHGLIPRKLAILYLENIIEIALVLTSKLTGIIKFCKENRVGEARQASDLPREVRVTPSMISEAEAFPFEYGIASNIIGDNENSVFNDSNNEITSAHVEIAPPTDIIEAIAERPTQRPTQRSIFNMFSRGKKSMRKKSKHLRKKNLKTKRIKSHFSNKSTNSKYKYHKSYT